MKPSVRVLLVEADLSDARSVCQQLASAGLERFDIIHADQLEDALARLQTGGFDAVLVDPSGFDAAFLGKFLRVCREVLGVPFVLFTGAEDEMREIEAARLMKGKSDSSKIAGAIRRAVKRKRDEKALKLNGLRFRRLLETDTVGVAIANSERVIEGNDLFLQIIGYSRQEMNQGSIRWSEMMPQGYSAADQKALNEMTAREACTPFEREFIRKDGSRILVLAAASMLTRSPFTCIVFVSDLTGTRRTEQLLRDGEGFRPASDLSQSMIYDVDARSGRTSYIHGLSALLGYGSDDEVHTRDWWFTHIHPSDMTSVERSLLEARSKGGDYSLQYRVRRSDGEYIIVEDTGRIIMDATGQPLRTVGCIVDITERRQSEKALRESERRYHELADELERIVEERTTDLRKLNRILEMITDCKKVIVRGTCEKELLSDICRTIVDVGGFQVAWVGLVQDDETKDILLVAQAGPEEICLRRRGMSCSVGERKQGFAETAIHAGKPWVGCEFQRDPERSAESEEPTGCGCCSSIALPLVGDGITLGNLTLCTSAAGAFENSRQNRVLEELAEDLGFALMALRTRAERDRALQALEQRSFQLRMLAAELTHAEERERRRLAQAIHDHLQQLLVGAKFCADALNTRIRTKALQELLGQLNQFLSDSIESTRSLTFELSPPILYEAGLVRSLRWLGRWMKSKHGLKVGLQAAESAEPESEETRVILFQATRELLFNVVKHAQTDSADVEIQTCGEDQVCIVVSDRGVGFDPAQCEGDEAAQAGFGLFSMRGRMDLMGGEVKIDSAPGKGSRITLLAPRRRTASLERPALEAVLSVSPHAKLRGGSMRAGPKIRILVADDHAVMRHGLVRILQGHRDLTVVGEAGDGLEALELARQLNPDVIIMDVNMPRSNGIETTIRIGQELPGIKVIGLSVGDESEAGTAMREAGAVAYVSKAQHSEALIATIRGCFAGAA